MTVFHSVWIYLIVGLYGFGACLQYLSFHSLVLATLYFAIGSMLSLSGWMLEQQTPRYKLANVETVGALVFCILHSIVHPLAWFVSLFYWTVVYDAALLFSYSDPIHLYLNGIFGHIVNVLFLVGDLYLATCHPLICLPVPQTAQRHQCKVEDERADYVNRIKVSNGDNEKVMTKIDHDHDGWRLLRALLPIAVFTIYESYVIVSFDFFDNSLPYGSLVSILTNGKGQFIWSQLIPFLLLLKTLIFGFHLLTDAIIKITRENRYIPETRAVL